MDRDKGAIDSPLFLQGIGLLKLSYGLSISGGCQKQKVKAEPESS